MQAAVWGCLSFEVQRYVAGGCVALRAAQYIMVFLKRQETHMAVKTAVCLGQWFVLCWAGLRHLLNGQQWALAHEPGSTIQFRATAWDSYDNEMSNPAVTWSASDPLAGTISAGGILTAGLGSGLVPDVVVATSNGTSDSASIMIVWPYRIYLPLVQQH